MILKECSKCLMHKELSNFAKAKKAKDGMQWNCKQCKQEYKKINAENIKEIQKQYRDNNKEIIRQNSKEYKKNNFKMV